MHDGIMRRGRCVSSPRKAPRTRLCLPVSRQRSRVRFRAASPKRELRLYRVPGDGNCQFRALAHAITQHPRLARDLRDVDVSHVALRRVAADYIEAHAELHAFTDYDVALLQRDGVYGDHLTLHTLATVLATDILVAQPGGHETLVTGTRRKAHGRPLLIFHVPEMHYDSVLV